MATKALLTAAATIICTVATAHAQDPHRVPHDMGLYDPACCNLRDCRPDDADRVKDTRDGLFVQGYGIMSYTDPRLRTSRDDRNHICEYGGKLVCVYQKPKGF
jgi:hypothetical protein